jgi:hypothetical protein
MEVRGLGEMGDTEDTMFAYKVWAVGALIAIGCTMIAVVTLAEKLMSQ